MLEEKIDNLKEWVFENYYQEIYDKYCELHPELITSDFVLEEDGEWEYINDIIMTMIIELWQGKSKTD